MRRTLIFHGSFNPFHFGHMRLLQHAVRELKPDLSVVAPFNPTHTIGVSSVGVYTRYDMVRLSVDSCMPQALSEMVRVELLPNEPHDGVRHLAALHADAEAWMLVGASGAREVRFWGHAVGRSLAKTVRIAAARDASPRDLAILKDMGFSVKMLSDYKPSPVTSERVRGMLSKGASGWRRCVPRPVASMIESSEYYGLGRVRWVKS